MRVEVVLEPSEERGYAVYAPSLPECISEEDTIEEVLRNIREAVETVFRPIEVPRTAGDKGEK